MPDIVQNFIADFVSAILALVLWFHFDMDYRYEQWKYKRHVRQLTAARQELMRKESLGFVTHDEADRIRKYIDKELLGG